MYMKLLDSIFDKSLDGLSTKMDLTWKRNQALTANIANAETPQYRAVDVSFGKELERAFGNNTDTMTRTSPGHLDVADNDTSKFVSDETGTEKSDGNNVDIDLQMGRLSDNMNQYASAAKLIRRQLGIIRTAIRDGR
jgi:flagellar basal-body rod protein FlgB